MRIKYKDLQVGKIDSTLTDTDQLLGFPLPLSLSRPL